MQQGKGPRFRAWPHPAGNAYGSQRIPARGDPGESRDLRTIGGRDSPGPGFRRDRPEGTRASPLLDQLRDDRGGVDAEDPGDDDEFRDFEPPLAALVIGDEGLRAAEPVGEVGLPEAPRPPRLEQAPPQPVGRALAPSGRRRPVRPAPRRRGGRARPPAVRARRRAAPGLSVPCFPRPHFPTLSEIHAHGLVALRWIVEAASERNRDVATRAAAMRAGETPMATGSRRRPLFGNRHRAGGSWTRANGALETFQGYHTFSLTRRRISPFAAARCALRGAPP